jgi:hypothetical protein
MKFSIYFLSDMYCMFLHYVTPCYTYIGVNFSLSVRWQWHGSEKLREYDSTQEQWCRFISLSLIKECQRVEVCNGLTLYTWIMIHKYSALQQKQNNALLNKNPPSNIAAIVRRSCIHPRLYRMCKCFGICYYFCLGEGAKHLGSIGIRSSYFSLLFRCKLSGVHFSF